MTTIQMVTVVFLLLVGGVALHIGKLCRDEMFRWFGCAFLLFSASGSVHLFEGDLVHWGNTLLTLVSLLLYGAGSTCLVTGAINGRRVYIETPFVMGVSILVSSVVAVVGDYASTFPLAFALFIGGAVAAWFLIERDDLMECSMPYIALGAGLLCRGTIALVGAVMSRHGIAYDQMALAVIDLLLITAIFAAVVSLAECRLRKRSACEG